MEPRRAAGAGDAPGGQVLIDPRDEAGAPPARRLLEWFGLSAEFAQIRGPQSFAYRWSGPRHYLALHDIRLADGETRLEGAPAQRWLNLRERMTFAPPGCEIAGWSALTAGRHSFTAVYFDPEFGRREIGERWRAAPPRPLLYFADPALRATLGKLQALLTEPGAPDAAYAETLGVLAALEVERRQHAGDGPAAPASGRLPLAQERLVRDYIEANLHADPSLGELAGLVRLSRFHFIRAFKRATGLPPHRFMLLRRIERASALLLDTDLPLAEVATAVGFASRSRFTAAFRKVTGDTPGRFRAARR